MSSIDLKEAIKILRSGEWLSLTCLTADLVKNTGGKLIQYTQCRIARLKLMQESNAESTSFSGIAKPAQHNFHFTINLELKNGQIRKVHPILITRINNLKVL